MLIGLVTGTTPMLKIHPADINDVSVLTALIRELADYERLSHEAILTEADIARDGFGENPKFRALIAEWEGQAVGYACFFELYSTFHGCAGLFLEDIFVRPQFRGKGIGKALLAQVADVACKEGNSCLRWEVLDWNTPAIEFYRKLGSEFRSEWKSVCLLGDALQTVAKGAR